MHPQGLFGTWLVSRVAVRSRLELHPDGTYADWCDGRMVGSWGWWSVEQTVQQVCLRLTLDGAKPMFDVNPDGTRFQVPWPPVFTWTLQSVAPSIIAFAGGEMRREGTDNVLPPPQPAPSPAFDPAKEQQIRAIYARIAADRAETSRVIADRQSALNAAARQQQAKSAQEWSDAVHAGADKFTQTLR